MIPTTTSGYRSGFIGCKNPNDVTDELAHKYLLKELSTKFGIVLIRVFPLID